MAGSATYKQSKTVWNHPCLLVCFGLKKQNLEPCSFLIKMSSPKTYVVHLSINKSNCWSWVQAWSGASAPDSIWVGDREITKQTTPQLSKHALGPASRERARSKQAIFHHLSLSHCRSHINMLTHCTYNHLLHSDGLHTHTHTHALTLNKTAVNGNYWDQLGNKRWAGTGSPPTNNFH